MMALITSGCPGSGYTTARRSRSSSPTPVCIRPCAHVELPTRVPFLQRHLFASPHSPCTKHRPPSRTPALTTWRCPPQRQPLRLGPSQGLRQVKARHRLQLRSSVGVPYCSCERTRSGRHKHPMENPYCSCKLTRSGRRAGTSRQCPTPVRPVLCAACCVRRAVCGAVCCVLRCGVVERGD